MKEMKFKIAGAGTLKIGCNSNSKCGDKEGFSFGVSWGKYGFAGGILPLEDAINLADHILKNVKRSVATEAKSTT